MIVYDFFKMGIKTEYVVHNINEDFFPQGYRFRSKLLNRSQTGI